MSTTIIIWASRANERQHILRSLTCVAVAVYNMLVQGALLCLAAATVGLGEPSEGYLRQIVPPVLASFTDQDSRVRYYACEALYNIAKVGNRHKYAMALLFEVGRICHTIAASCAVNAGLDDI